MIYLCNLSYNSKELTKEVTKYVNRNIEEIIEALIDDIKEDEDFTVDYFMSYNKHICSNPIWIDRIYELYEIISSQVMRYELKPKYEYLLYMILEWWDNVWAEVIPFVMDKELEKKIRLDIDDEELADYEIYSLTTVSEYQDFLFQDHDFLDENLSMLVTLYLYYREGYDNSFSDVDLDEYRELMPQDLLELYDEAKQRDIKIQEKKKLLLKTQEQLYEDIKFCCETVQADYTLSDAKENCINDRIRDLLNAKNYIAKDQTRHGISAGGKDAGNVDILIESDGETIALIEALKVDSMNKEYIAEHINKVFGYDTKGFRSNYILCYVKLKDFQQFADKYWNFIQEFPYKYNLEKCLCAEEKQYPELRTFETILNRQGVETNLTHILIHML